MHIGVSHNNHMTGKDTYNDWKYTVEYSEFSLGLVTPIVTFDPYLNLTGLTGDALYELDIVARGLNVSGDRRLSVPLVFSTKTEGECMGEAQCNVW